MSSEAWVAGGGILLQTVFYLLGIYAIYIRTDAKQEAHTNIMREDITDMKQELKKLAEVVLQQAVQSTRIDNLAAQVTQIDRRVEDLRRGNGYVKGRSGVDGEY